MEGTNRCFLMNMCDVRAFHFSAREPYSSLMTYSNPSVYMGAEGADEDTIMLTTERRVSNTIAALMEKE